MNHRKKIKDEKLAKIRADLFSARERAERGWKRLRRAWGRFDKLLQRVKYLQQRQAAREREIDAEPPANGRATS